MAGQDPSPSSSSGASPTRTASQESSPSFVLVGCSDCHALFVIEETHRAHGQTTVCRQCGARQPVAKCSRLATADSKAAVREKRSRILATRWGYDEEYNVELESYRQAGQHVDTVPSFRRVSRLETTEKTDSGSSARSARTEADDLPRAAERQLSKGADLKMPDCREHAPGEQTPDDALSLTIGPQSSEWTQTLLKRLLPTTLRLVEDLVDEWGASVRSLLVDETLDRDTVTASETRREIRGYHNALWRLYRKHAGLTALSQAEQDSLFETVTRLGTGRGDANASWEALEAVLALHSYGRCLSLEITLESDAWMDQLRKHPDTVERSLTVLKLLGDEFDVWISPVAQSLKSRLWAKFPNLVDGLLTEPQESPRPVSRAEWSEQEVDRAWDALSEFEGQAGHLTALYTLADGGEWTYEELSRDRRQDVSKGTLQKYVPELASEELVEIDKSSRTHLESISERGKLAVGLFLPEGDRIRPRKQLTLTESTSLSTSRVSGRDSRQEGIEDWVADFEGGGRDGREGSTQFAQWLSVDGIQDITTHRRYALLSDVQDGSGVTLVSHPDLPSFSDARKTRISHLEDHVVVVAQWGRSLPTLARICNSLLDPRLLASALSESDVVAGVEDAAGESLSQREVLDQLTKATQLGYLSEDEIRDFEDWRDRWSKIPPRLLSRLSDLNELSGDALVDERGELFRRFHGAIASATALYKLAGKDITIQVRFPDTKRILDDDQRTADVRQFCRHTIPKNALVDGLHSWYREHIETDAEKLKRRITPDYDELVADGTLAASSTVDWQFVGDHGEQLLPIVQEGLNDAEALDIREQLVDGNESGMPLEVPIRRGSHFANIKTLIKRVARDKGMEFSGRRDKAVERLTTMFEAILGGDEHGASPISVATALLTLRSARDGTETLTVGDIASGLGHLKSGELLPESNRWTEKQLLSALLSSSEPLSREELITRAGISRGSTSNLAPLEALDLVERTEDGCWRSTVEPWWAQPSSRDAPYETELGDDEPAGQHWENIIGRALKRLEKRDELSKDEWLDLYLDGLQNALETLELGRFVPVIRHYRGDRNEWADNGTVATLGGGLLTPTVETNLSAFEAA